MTRSGHVFILLLVFFIPAFACADTVVLKSGMRLEGQIVAEDAGSLTVQVGGSKMTIKRELVREVIRGGAPAFTAAPSPPPKAPAAEEYRTRLAALRKDDPNAQFELGTWCAQHELKKEALEHLLAAATATAAHPGAEEAAAKLGSLLVKGKFYTLDEILSSEAPAMTEQERLSVLDRVVTLGEFDSAKKAALVTELSAAYEEAGRWDDVARLWPPYARLASAQARSAAEHAQADAIVTVLHRYPDGAYEVQSVADAAARLGVTKANPALKDSDVAAGRHALASPGVLEVAIRDLVLEILAEAEKILEQAQKMVTAEPDLAGSSEVPKADKALARAEALAPGVSRPYVLDGIRQRLAAAKAKIEEHIQDAEKEAPWNYSDYWVWEGGGAFTAESRKLWAKRTAAAQRCCDRAIELARSAAKVPKQYAEELQPELDAIEAAYGNARRFNERLKEEFGRRGADHY